MCAEIELTDVEIEKVWKRVQANDFHDCVQPFARAIEAKIKEKNTQQRLTEREIELINGMIDVQLQHAEQCDRLSNQTMARKQKGWDMERVGLLRRFKEQCQALRADTWVDPNDKTQKQYLPHIGEPVLFCHNGMTYMGKHTGGSFQSEITNQYFNTWECHWMYLPAAHGIKEKNT